MAGFERRSDHATSGGLDFLTARDKVRPIGALDKNVGEDLSDQLTRRVLIEERYGIDSLEGGGYFRALGFGEQGAGRTLKAARAGVRIEGEDEDIPHGAAAFEEANVAGVHEVIATVGEDHGLSGPPPEPALCGKFGASVEASHRFQCNSRAGGDWWRADVRELKDAVELGRCVALRSAACLGGVEGTGGSISFEFVEEGAFRAGEADHDVQAVGGVDFVGCFPSAGAAMFQDAWIGGWSGLGQGSFLIGIGFPKMMMGRWGGGFLVLAVPEAY